LDSERGFPLIQPFDLRTATGIRAPQVKGRHRQGDRASDDDVREAGESS
jgi:hypothetical protein